MKKFFAEFKKFITRGNVIELAVGIVIGTAFTAIVNSFVNDILMPLLATVLNKVDLTELSWHLKGDIYIKYGNFIQVIINFVLIAISIFVMLKAFNHARDKAQMLKNGLATVKAKIKEDKELDKFDLWCIKKHKTSLEGIKEEIAKEDEEKRIAEEDAKKPALTDQLLMEMKELIAKTNELLERENK